MRLLLGSLCALSILLPACASRVGPRRPASAGRALESDTRLDRGDWMVAKGTEIAKVMEAQDEHGTSRPPRHIGYLIGRDYRQQHGGPTFRIYEVTTLNRSDVIGRIDQLGRVTRMEPRRNRTFEEVTVPHSGMENDVGAIFGTLNAISIEKTDARHVAFEALDTNHDGLLQPAETASFGSRIANADMNHDGAVDFQEFDAVEL